MNERWVTMAEKALLEIGIEGANLEFLAQTHNVIFKATPPRAGEGELPPPLIVRIHQPSIPFQRLRYEFENLQRLSPSLQVPKAIHMTVVDGYPIFVTTYLIGEARQPQTLTPTDIRLVGAFLGKWHRQGYHSPHPQHLDFAGLFGDEGLYPLTDVHDWFSDDDLLIIHQVMGKVAEVMDSVGKTDLQYGLIHGDLLLNNILFDGTQVKAIDFEYCTDGYYLYDLAPLLWQLKPLTHYHDLADAYWDSYCTVRPDMRPFHNLLETFVAARHLASIRWVALNQLNPMISPYAKHIVAHRLAELARFLQDNVLHRTHYVP